MNSFKWLTKNVVLSVRDCMDGAKNRTEQKMLMLARILDFSFLQRELDIANKQLSLVPKIRLSRSHYLRCFYSGRLGKVEILTLGVGFWSFWENEKTGKGKAIFLFCLPSLFNLSQLVDVLELSIFYASINTHAP